VPLERFGVSMNRELLQQLDQAIEEAGYANRSEAVRDMARAFLVNRQWEAPDGEVVGTITLVYDHHVPGVVAKLTALQHDAEPTVICNTHVHLDHHNCIEVIVAQGAAEQVRRLADRMISARGVKHGQLTRTAVQQ